MTSIRSLLQQMSAGDQSGDRDADLVLGLPLKTDDRTIYPVFLDPQSGTHNGAEPRQIGYLELSGNRSDFISLEPVSRATAAVPVILLILLIGVLFAWRAFGNQSRNRLR